MSKAYLNALQEKGSRQEIFEWLCIKDADCDQLRADKRRLDEELAVLRKNYEALQNALTVEQLKYSELLKDYYIAAFMSNT